MKNSSKFAFVAIFIILIVALLNINVIAYTSPVDHNDAINEGNDDEHYEYFTDGCAGSVSEEAYYSSDYSTVSATAGIRLSGLEKQIYDELKAKITSVANETSTSTSFSITSNLSELSWTKEELGCEIMSGNSYTSEAKDALKKALYEKVDISRIIKCLLADCPYELFWFDKTASTTYNYQFRGNTSRMYMTSLTYNFVVSEDYRSGSASDYKVDSTKISVANAALKNAKAIVNKYADKSDLEKLEAYRDEIHALSDYNAWAYGTAYGNPWQLIYVFDGDPSTKVVCEGYSKAFKYLCDLSDFDKNVYCYLASGYLIADNGPGRHMWNVVFINGINYLVDITNCDADKPELFLAGGTSSPNHETHTIKWSSINSLKYQYREDQSDLFCDGYLALSETYYHEHRYIAWKSNDAQHWRECSCGEKNDISNHTPATTATCSSKAVCSVCKSEYGNLLPHTYNKQITTATYLKSVATCTSKAVYYYSCSCGTKDTSTYEIGDILPHNYTVQNTSDKYLKTPATCTTKAVYFYSCACGAASTSTFNHGDFAYHNYTVKNTDAKYLKSSANCTNKAIYYYSCACGEKGTSTFEYGEFSHTYNWQNPIPYYQKSPATCTSKAVYYYVCICGKQGTETYEHGDILPHEYTVQNVEKSYLKSEATCTSPASYYYICSCGSKSTESFSFGEPMGHVRDMSGTCIECGDVLETNIFDEPHDLENNNAEPRTFWDRLIEFFQAVFELLFGIKTH